MKTPTASGLLWPLIPIVPSSRLYLRIHGLPGEARFARLFRDVWQHIPLPARRALVRHWRRSPCALYGIPLPTSQRSLLECGILTADVAEFGPRIELVPDRTCFVDCPPDTSARCTHKGFLLQFLAPLIVLLEDRPLGILIAHELAHALLYATTDEPQGTSRAEIDVMELLEAWGFDEDELDAALCFKRTYNTAVSV